MNARGTAVRLVVGLVVTFLVGGCAAGASVSPSSPLVTTASPTTAAATPTPRPTPTVVATANVTYESANPTLVPGTLDVYAPTRAGPWPVVVMLHGAPGSDPVTDRSYLGMYSRLVAELGFVVFNASWGQVPGADGSEAPDAEGLLAVQSQAACAVEFARAKASEFGGDPTTMIVFGHSGGAHAAAMVAFNRPEPTLGCLGGATLGTIDALVTWEGNWLLSVNYPDWNAALAADPGVMDLVTPWRSLPDQKDLRVVMLTSDHPGTFFEREVGDPWTADSWLGVRDPSGDLRRQLEANGAIADGILDFVDVQRLLYSVLEAQGNPVSLDVMPDSVHDRLGTAGWPVFLGAFQKAAAKD
jgi:acetyl esterase/lipase